MGSVRKTETGSVLNFNTYLPKTLDETKISFTPKQSGSGTPSPENVREIVGKNGITVWQSNKGVFHNLPSAYQEVEYLEGTGTQKIDTGIVIDDSNFNISCRFVLPEYYGTGEYPVFSIWRSTPNYFNCFVRVANSKMSVYTTGHHQPNTTIIEEGAINDIALSRTDTTWTFTHNEETIDWTYSPTTSNDTTLKVFTRGDGNAASHIRVYSLTVEVEGELVGDFVPCYRKSDSVAGLYDLVTKTFFTNYADDTNFVVGEDIVGVETSVSFPAVGKNLCPDISTWESGYTNNGGRINPANSTRLEKYSDYIPVDELENYTFSYNADGITEQLWTCICAYDENKEYIFRHISNSNFVSRKLIAGTRFVRLSCRTYGMTTEAQFEKSAEPTAYEPFDNTIYGGYVDLVNGEVVAEWTKVNMGDLTWRLYEKCWTCSPSDIKIHTYGDARIADLVCDIYEQGQVTTASQFRDTPEGQLVARNNYTDIGIKDSSYTSAEDFKTAVTGHYLAYKLAEPIHYPLSPRILTTLRGNNVMWNDGDSLTVSYTDDVVNTYDFRRHISLDTPHKASASGAVASFGTDMVGKMKCKIHFSPQQEGSGTPSPDNVRNISGRNSVKLWQSGKNLFNKASAKMGRYESVDGVWTLVENAIWYASDLIRVKPNTRYSMFGGTPLASVGAYINVYDEDMTRVNYTTHLSYIDTTANAKYLSVHSTGTGSFYKNRDTIMICEGSDVPSEYKPYTGNEITFTFPSTVGDNGVVYGGYLDAENGEVVEEYYTFTLDGTNNKLDSGGTILNGNECEAYAYFGQGTLSGIPRGRGTFYTQLYSNLLPTVRQTSGRGEIVQADDVVNYIRVQLYAETIGVTSGATSTEVIDAINTWLTAHPMQVCYPLRDPVHYSLTPQSIATLRGRNRIWSDGDSVEVEYYKHTDEPQEYIPAEVLGTGNIAIVTSDGYLIGEEQDFIKY